MSAYTQAQWSSICCLIRKHKFFGSKCLRLNIWSLNFGWITVVGWAPYFLFCHFPYVFQMHSVVLFFPSYLFTPSCAGVSIAKTKNFTYNVLVGATNNFHRSNKIGRGGFGTVYKVSLNATYYIPSHLHWSCYFCWANSKVIAGWTMLYRFIKMCYSRYYDWGAVNLSSYKRLNLRYKIKFNSYFSPLEPPYCFKMSRNWWYHLKVSISWKA